MANEITIDTTPADQPEFSAEEQESLQIGEELAQQQEQLLAGKYKDAQELEKAYIELQQKLGQSNDQPQETEVREEDAQGERDEEEVSPNVKLITEAAQEYFDNDGQLSAETLAKFNEMSSQQLVEAYMEIQRNAPTAEPVADLSESEVNVIQNQVGGEQAYGQLMQWAGQNLDQSYVEAFDSLVNTGNLQAIQLAVAGLQSTYEAQNGYEGRMLTGKQPSSAGDTFRSQAEVVAAMQDPRYDRDPAYRNDVFEKLERSNLQY